jgi:pyridoxal phosphate enzyme (YggS family)
VSEIASNISVIKSEIGPEVRLVAVSKTKPVRDIIDAYDAGQRLFGENRVQELLNKKDQVPWDVEWHLIGHLQTNKVRFVVPFISMIESVDSIKLLNTINAEAMKINRTINCLLQIHIAEEETKYGFSHDELKEAGKNGIFNTLDHIRLCGVMGMATFSDNNDQVRKEFAFLRQCFLSLKKDFFGNSLHFREISMGMSGDYRIAVEEGSTMVRIGSLIFGERLKQ